MMRTAALAIALLMSGAAIAQTYETDTNVDADVGVQPDTDLDVDADVSTQTDVTTDPGMTTQTDTTTTTMAPTQTPVTTAIAPASAAVVAPGNDDPEHDARGIPLLPAPAALPAGLDGHPRPPAPGPPL